VVRHVAVAHHRAHADAAARQLADFSQRQLIDVEQRCRRLDVQLHQVDDRRPTSEKSRASRSGGLDRRPFVRNRDEAEWLHDYCPADRTD
jgi:hypothetical protein